MQAIILAGGEGTRLRPLTDHLPKPLVPLKDKPFCLYQISWLKGYGIKKIVFAVGYLADKIKTTLEDGCKFGTNIRYAFESKPLGTGGAIRNAICVSGACDSDDFLVMNGDILTNINLKPAIDFHFKKKALVTLVLIKTKETDGFGRVCCDRGGRLESFVEKMPRRPPGLSLINGGIYLLNQKVIDYIPKDSAYSFEKQLIPDLINKGLPVYGYACSGYWLDIGTKSRYLKAQTDIGHLKL